MKSRAVSIVIALVLAGAAVLAANGTLDRVVAPLGLDWLAARNDRYLQDAAEKATGGFLVLSLIKSALAVVEGSSVGVGFDLELGDAVQSIYDYVDLAWRTTLSGSVVLLLTRLICESVRQCGHGFLAGFLLLAALHAVAAGLAPERWRNLFRRPAAMLLTIVLTLYLVLPLSVFAAARLSERITLPLIDDALSNFEQASADLKLDETAGGSPSKAAAGWFDSAWNLGGMVAGVKDSLLGQINGFRSRTDSMARSTIRLIAGYLFDCLIFPAVIFLLLSTVIRSLLQQLPGLSRDEDLRRELAALVARLPMAVGTPSARPSEANGK